jgi:hypothetical protein
VHASHEALTLRSPIAHPGSPWLALLAKCECLKRHGVGEREGELGADFTSLVSPKISGNSYCWDIVVPEVPRINTSNNLRLWQAIIINAAEDGRRRQEIMGISVLRLT